MCGASPLHQLVSHDTPGMLRVMFTCAAAASLLEIQEEESRTAAQQNAAVPKEKLVPVQPPAAMAPGGGWNVQPVKASSLVDIMQEDESKRQAQVTAQSKLLQQQLTSNPNAKQVPVCGECVLRGLCV